MKWCSLQQLVLVPVALIASAILFSSVQADDHDDKFNDRVSAKLTEIQTWANDRVIVNAVKSQNEEPAEVVKGMTQETWKSLSVLDPTVRQFTKNDVARFLKSKKDATTSEAFVSAANGCKVGFLSKPTNWNHSGKPKHDQPMKGQVWRGPVEVDDSTGVQQMQVAVPVLDDGKPIGSLVVGLDVTKLKEAK